MFRAAAPFPTVDFTVRLWQLEGSILTPTDTDTDTAGAITAATAITAAVATAGGTLQRPNQRQPPGHEGYFVNAVAVSADGSLIATGAGAELRVGCVCVCVLGGGGKMGLVHCNSSSYTGPYTRQDA